MASFDGSDFTGIDDEAINPDRPADTFVEHRLRDQEYYLWENADRVWHNWLTDGNDMTNTSNGRAFSSINRTIIWTRLVWLQPGVDKIRCHFFGYVTDGDDGDNTSHNITVRLKLARRDSAFAEKDFSSDTGATVVYEPRSVEGSPKVDQAGWHLLTFSIESEGAVVINSGEQTTGLVDEEAKLNKFVDPNIGPHTYLDEANGTGQHDFLHYEEVDLDDDTTTDQLGVLEPGLPVSSGQESSTQPSMLCKLQKLTRIKIRGMHWEIDYDAKQVSGGWTNYDQQRIRAREPVETSHGRHRKNTNNIASRPILLSLGTQGRDQPIDSSSKGYDNANVLMPRAQPYNGAENMIDEAIKADRTDARLETKILAIATRFGSYRNTSRSEDPSGDVTWEVKIQELTAGDTTSSPTTLSTDTKTETMRFFRTDTASQYPFLQQMYRFDEEDSAASYLWREGHLWPEDLGLLFREGDAGVISIESDLDGVSYDETKPLRWNVDVRSNTDLTADDKITLIGASLYRM